MTDIGTRIKLARKHQGMTLQELADAVGVGASTVRKWEIGMIKNLGADKISKLADALHVPVRYLLGFEEGATRIPETLPADRRTLLKCYDALDSEQQIKLLSMAIDLANLV